ncbi:MAG: bifunctional oligoribonuclease/PAP phosphatase NrnA [Lachnospiraceae bacterium]|nr:bifunctional oligoribonuclease/PAP phosphatase NrnA [Lachnospiraceae bacterium]
MNILQECSGAKRIGISGHIRPDGDCVGSCLALCSFLRKQMPEAAVTVFLENPPETFKNLVGFEEISSDFNVQEPMDVFFALDCSEDRLGGAQPIYEKAAKKINIDHHISNKGCGDISLVVPEASATAEVLYDLLVQGGIDTEIAEALYVGIIHDCGVFQYSNTSPRTLEIGAKLIQFGFNFPKIIEETFYQKTYLQTQIMGRALMESIRFMDGSCIVSCVDKKEMEFYNVTSKDMDGIVNQLRNIKGVHCAIFMYQTDVLEYKVSMRSDELVNVAEVASYFGGGGHMRAAGCTMKGTFHDCVNNLSFHIEKQMKENKDV